MSRGDNIANLVTIALGIFVTYHSYYSLRIGILISPGAGFLPFLCGVALIALGIFWRIQSFLFKTPRHAARSQDPAVVAGVAETPALPRPRVTLCLAFVTALAYAWLFERIGLFLSTLVFMLGWQMLVERERWLKSIIITALCAAAMYTLFRYLLRVELPSNPLFS
ncbi:MAG: tripartite tricarboxylate transporter TctB family protein [Desulfobacterales bacterium]|nr:tripartite tricarboxylate transporter TctB family protein [Desulfobacterales bacterium]